MREKKDEPEHHELMAELSVRVISIMDRRPTGKEIHGIMHPGLFLISLVRSLEQLWFKMLFIISLEKLQS